MPKLKKITARKKIETPEVSGNVLDDENPADQKRLIHAMINFIGQTCMDVLGYERSALHTKESGPLNLNAVYEKLLALKVERDSWRTRCENIEAAFNALSAANDEREKNKLAV